LNGKFVGVFASTEEGEDLNIFIQESTVLVFGKELNMANKEQGKNKEKKKKKKEKPAPPKK
jgi:hypothetical protein